MYETYTTITGRVMTEPRRRSAASGQVLSFRVACNSRKRDRETGEWNDGPSLYLTVACWDKLAAAADGVIARGSRVIARGQLRTNEYVAGDGTKRADLEMKVMSIGLDLAHARSLTTPVPEGHSGPERGEDEGWSSLPGRALPPESSQVEPVVQTDAALRDDAVPAAGREAAASFP